MRTRDEVLREFPNVQRVLKGERTVWRDRLAPEIKRMADEIVRLRAQLTTAERERDGWKHRAERAERVVEAARVMIGNSYVDGFADRVMSEADVVALAEAVRALDAAEKTNA